MTMCAACSALQLGGREHAGLMSKGRRGLQSTDRVRMSGGEYFICRLCGAEWCRDNGMHPVPKKKPGWPLASLSSVQDRMRLRIAGSR